MSKQTCFTVENRLMELKNTTVYNSWAHIAHVLNEEGMRTGKGDVWTYDKARHTYFAIKKREEMQNEPKRIGTCRDNKFD